MKDHITLAELRQVGAQLARHIVPFHRVGSQEEAEAMTARDPNGYKWTVGEEYFILKLDL